MSEPFLNVMPPVEPLSANGQDVSGKDLLSRADIFDEKLFRRMLALERKRSERSNARFVLMLLESASLLRLGTDQQGVPKVLGALSRSSRETDIKGWYRHGVVLGIIFTEIGAADGKMVASALLSRVTNALSEVLSIEEIHEIKLSFHVFPELSGSECSGPDHPLYPDLRTGRKTSSRVAKRAIDILGSLLAIIMLFPFLVLIAAAIKLTSRGPILFRQVRVGQYGREFTFVKFRSMYSDNDQTVHREYVVGLISGRAAGDESGPHRQRAYKLTDDPRVTPVGRWLRRTSFDEVPQFLNVLKAEMSLVGPRPPIPYEVACYATWHRRRLMAVKPGITGLWQVAGRSRVKFDEMVRLDLQYARSWSVWLDLKILWKTPKAVFSCNGAW